jgi:hypothetical protein
LQTNAFGGKLPAACGSNASSHEAWPAWLEAIAEAVIGSNKQSCFCCMMIGIEATHVVLVRIKSGHA